MAWFDYIPGVSNVHGLMNGNVAQAFGGPVGYALNKPGQDAANNAANAQRSALDKAMSTLQDFSQQQYQNRMADLNKTMEFYGPAQRYLEQIYGPHGGPQPLASGPPGMGPTAAPPGFPKSAVGGGAATALNYGQGPRRGF